MDRIDWPVCRRVVWIGSSAYETAEVVEDLEIRTPTSVEGDDDQAHDKRTEDEAADQEVPATAGHVVDLPLRLLQTRAPTSG